MNNSVAQAFGNHFLNAFGIQLPRIVEHIPTEILTISGKEHIIQDLFRLEDNTLLHIEYQSSPNPKDLDQLFFDLMWYDLKIYEQHGKLVSTIVVLGPEIDKAELSRDLGAIRYKVTDVVWLSRWNVDQTAEEFAKKVGQECDLTDEELSTLVLMPFMHTKGSRFQMAKEAVKIANQVDREKRDLVIKLMKVTAGKVLSGDDYAQVVQAIERA